MSRSERTGSDASPHSDQELIRQHLGMATLPTSKFNPGVVVTSMPPSYREMKKARRNALKLSGKLSLEQVRAIRRDRRDMNV